MLRREIFALNEAPPGQGLKSDRPQDQRGARICSEQPTVTGSRE